MNSIVGALRFIFTHTLDRPDLARKLVRTRQVRKIPGIADHGRGEPKANTGAGGLGGAAASHRGGLGAGQRMTMGLPWHFSSEQVIGGSFTTRN
jgi:hypothetical protein